MADIIYESIATINIYKFQLKMQLTHLAFILV